MKPKHIFYFLILMLVLISSAAPASAPSPPQPPPPLSPEQNVASEYPMPPTLYLHYIHTKDELLKMNEIYFASGWHVFRLMSDIEIDTTYPWNPIGSARNPFSGGFSGNGHTITFKNDVVFAHHTIVYSETGEARILLTGAADDGHGFFGNIYRASITSLDLVFQGNVTSMIYVRDNETGLGNNTGSLVGVMTGTNSWIMHCSAKSQGHFIYGKNNVGGLIGLAMGGNPNWPWPTSITNSSSDFSVKAEQNNAGGLIGYAAHIIIIDSSATGSVEAQGGSTGGLIGHLGPNVNINPDLGEDILYQIITTHPPVPPVSPPMPPQEPPTYAPPSQELPISSTIIGIIAIIALVILLAVTVVYFRRNDG